MREHTRSRSSSIRALTAFLLILDDGDDASCRLEDGRSECTARGKAESHKQLFANIKGCNGILDDLRVNNAFVPPVLKDLGWHDEPSTSQTQSDVLDEHSSS